MTNIINFLIKRKDLVSLSIALLSLAMMVKFNSDIHYSNLIFFYCALFLISIATTFISEKIVNCIFDDYIFNSFQYKFLIYLSGFLLTVVYGPQFFIKYYEYDDWVYLSYQFENFNFSYLNSAVNFHYVPIFKALMYLISRFSDPTYLINSIAFYLVTMMILSALGRLLRIHNSNSKVLIISLISFAIWPSFETARTWFGGGFWLSIPVFSFLGSLLIINQLLNNDDPKIPLFIKLFILNCITVLSSSQIIFPSLLILFYIIPFLVFGKNTSKNKKVNLIFIFTLSIIPSFFAVLGRLYLVRSNIDYHGIYNGDLFRNILAFIARRVLMIDGREFKTLLNGSAFKYFICVSLVLVSILVFNFLYKFFKENKQILMTKKFSYAYSSILLGMAILFIFALQVGLARSWEIYATINAYYCTFPLVGFVLLVSGISSVCLESRPNSFFRINWIIYIFLLAIIFAYSIKKYFPNEQYINDVNYQKVFVKDFGHAVCAEISQLNSDMKLYLIPKYSFTSCHECTLLFKAPDSFLITSSDDETFFQVLAKSSAKDICPAESNRLVIKKHPNALVSSGESDQLLAFYRKYYN